MVTLDQTEPSTKIGASTSKRGSRPRADLSVVDLRSRRTADEPKQFKLEDHSPALYLSEIQKRVQALNPGFSYYSVPQNQQYSQLNNQLTMDQ